METLFNGYLLSDDSAKLRREDIFALLASSYWAKERSRQTIEKSIENSLCFGAYKEGRQVAFARAVHDGATIFWLCDVIVEESHRGHGLGTAFVDFIVSSERLKGLNGVLATKDAHELYAKFGFSTPDKLFMGRLFKDAQRP